MSTTVNWTFHWHLPATGETRQTTIPGRDIHNACFEFHAETQLAHKLARDSYQIDRVVSNHTTENQPTPQTYQAADLPAINPDASTFKLPELLRRKIYPDDKS